MADKFDEVELAKEIETNRKQLGTVIPARLHEQLTAIDGVRNQLNEWYVSLLIKIGNSVVRVCHDLYQTIDQEDALPAAAWNARNLLELWVWIKYCSVALENARRFHEDALRDVFGLIEAHAAICKIVGIQNEYDVSMRSAIAEVARKQSIDSLDANYVRVVAAADSVGLGRPYKAYNTHLSKFAHPTAGLVLGLMHQTDAVRHYQSNCTTMGLYYCGQCVIAFDKMIAAIPVSRNQDA